MTPSLPSSSPESLVGPQLLLRLKFELRAQLGRHPATLPLFRPFIWWNQYKMWGINDPSESQVDRRTELIIDGFQGSANSFATAAFKSCQSRPVRLAHHLHAPAQIIRGVRWGIPVLVTLRTPADAVISLVSRWPYLRLSQGLRAYSAFYEALLPHVDGLVVSPFDMTTGQLDDVFEAVNERFGTAFDVFDHTPEQVRQIRTKTVLPTAEEAKRQKKKEALASALGAGTYRKGLERAHAVHDAMAQHALRPRASRAQR